MINVNWIIDVKLEKRDQRERGEAKGMNIKHTFDMKKETNIINTQENTTYR